MSMLLALTGVFAIAVLFVDALRVTMGKGGGVLTKRLSSWFWDGFLRVRRSRVPVRILPAAGPVIVLLTFAIWIVLLWGGWTLIFSSAERAIVHGRTQVAASFWERVYYTGYTIFTLGIGDYVPVRPFWQVMTAVASISGLFLVTFSISYLIPVLQANTQKRQLAAQIASLGQRPHEIVLNAYDGSNCAALGEHLNALTTELAKLEQRHLSYPLLHYFHSEDRTESAALSVAALDEALTTIEHGLAPPAQGLSPARFHPARRIIGRFLGTLAHVFVEPAAEAPSPPSLETLREQGIPVVDDATFRRRLDALAERRRMLLALVENDGWAWELLEPARRRGTERQAASPDASPAVAGD